ncbi:MAG: hypothetical protein ACXWWE_03160 [Nitrospira sp.]|jgi:hypothetical protein
MKSSFNISLLLVTGALGATVAFANPALLPQHPGYPMGKAIDPVSGQSLANDPGQVNAGGESALTKAAAFSDRNLSQQLSAGEQDKQLPDKSGAAAQPKMQDPTMDSPTKGSTKGRPSPQ